MLLSGQPLRRPLVGSAVFIAGGMALASCEVIQFHHAMVLALIMLVLGFVLIRFNFASLFVFVSIGCVAAVRFLASDTEHAGSSIDQRLGDLPLPDFSVIGHVCGAPRYYAFKNGDRGMWVFPLQLEGILDSGTWYRQRGEIDVRVMGALRTEPVALDGQRVWLTGALHHRDYPGGNPIGLKVSSPGKSICLSTPRFSLMRWCQTWRESAARQLEIGLQDQPVQLAVLRSLVLGYRNEIPEDTYARFRRTGSLHIFAISGLHVGIVGLLLVAVLKSLGVPRDWFGVWLIPLLFIYVAATGMKASALRAMVMAGVFLLAPLFRRKPDIPTSVAFAAVLLLMLIPREIESDGFVFSFVVVAFIVMVYAAIPERLLSGGWVKSYATSLAITSFAASLASIPMTAYYFKRFSPIALVGNLIVVPLTFCIVLSGWLSILFPCASGIFNHASLAFINAMLWSVDGLDRIPGSSIPVDAPPAASILLWYGSLIYLMVHARRVRQRIYAVAGAGSAILWAVLC